MRNLTVSLDERATPTAGRSMSELVFVDTNELVYQRDASEPAKDRTRSLVGPPLPVRRGSGAPAPALEPTATAGDVRAATS